jgi:hypothetical protein
MDTPEESLRKRLYDHALAVYNEAYYKWLFGPKEDKQHNAWVLEKMRRNWFAT